MLFSERWGSGEPALVLMPFLSGSRREWMPVIERLRDDYACIGVDLPGFGDSHDVTGYSVAAMAESLMEKLQELKLARFALVGHSMAAKVAAVVARCAAEGDARVRGLEGLVLVTPSPPGPEPMSEKKRSQMLESLGGEPQTDERGRRKEREAAAEFIAENSADDLTEEASAVLVEDVLRMNRAAWRAWLESGSKEDWSERVGVLRLPVLLVAGDRDGSLGPEVQKTVSMPHWPNGRLATLHSNHLIPMEKPAELARLIGEFARGLNGDAARTATPLSVRAEVPVDPAYVELILSSRVSEATRKVLSERAEADDPAYEPQALTITELAQLRAVVDRVLPQKGVAIDLGARIDRRLAAGTGDGWRYAVLPGGTTAYKQGLATLEWYAREQLGAGWLALDGAHQDELLARAAAARLERGLLQRLEAAVGVGQEGGPAFDAEQMKRWFEEVRAAATKLYVAHPATLARMGYSGVADGADSEHQTGFVQIGEGERETWEPMAKKTTATVPGTGFVR